MPKSKVAVVLLLCAIFPFLMAGYVCAYDREEKPQVTVLFIDGLSFYDFQQLSRYPHVNKWLSRGDYAAMSIRSPGPRTAANSYLLMGSGGQAVYDPKSGTAYHLDEQLLQGGTARERMMQISGNRRYQKLRDGIIFPGIFELHLNNQEKPYVARIGLLGSLLQEAGMKVSLFGNGDEGAGNPQRQAALFAMNRTGFVPEGDVSAKASTAEAAYPFGVKTNYNFIYQQMMEQNKAGMTVVELADLQRLYRMRVSMDPVYFERLYRQILDDMDTFIGKVLEQRSSRHMVMLVSPAVNEEAKSNRSLLTPVVIWRENGQGDALSSATTRQPGIVSGIDVAPTILSWLSIPVPAELLGHVMVKSAEKAEPAIYPPSEPAVQSNPSESSFETFLSQVARIENIYANRPAVLYSYVMLQIVVLVSALLLWMWKERTGELFGHARKATRVALLTLLLFPFVFLLEPLFGWNVPAYAVIGTVIALASVFGLLMDKWRLTSLLLALAFVTVFSILADGMTGATAMRRSYMGYDPVVGARFYGLGNEYEGVLIGSSILLIAALYEWWNQRQMKWLGWRLPVALLCFSLILYYIAAPTLGTNAGGFLAGIIGFSVALFRLQGWKIGRRGGMVMCAALFLGVGILIAANLWSQQPLTHVGRVAQDIVLGNWEEVGNIITRKLEMNLKLIRVSSWSKVLLVSLFVLGVLSLRPERHLRDLSAKYPYLAKGFGGIVAGSLAGFALNDSGVISAATSIVFFVIPVLYAALLDHPEATG